jgi:outer membrane protein assembly factor BamB
MPDKLNYGEANMLVANGRVLTSNLDQSVQAYDAFTGTLVWSRRLSGYDYSLRLVGGSLVLFDYLGDDYTYSLVFLDPTDGSQQRAITPICPANEFAPDSLKPNAGLFFDEAENAIYLVYDSSPGCLQRLDLASGQVVWQTFGEGWYSFSPNGFTGLLTDTRVYFANGNELLAVDKADGTLTTLLADEDYEFVPLAMMDDALLVRARRTRGSERFELRALNAASGDLLWTLDLGDATPLDPPNKMSGLVDKDSSGWTWSLPAGQLTLFTFQAEPNQLVIQTLDPANGTLGGETIVPLKAVSGDFYSVPEIIGWRGERLYFEVDGIIYCVDVTTGKAVFHFR